MSLQLIFRELGSRPQESRESRGETQHGERIAMTRTASQVPGNRSGAADLPARLNPPELRFEPVESHHERTFVAFSSPDELRRR